MVTFQPPKYTKHATGVPCYQFSIHTTPEDAISTWIQHAEEWSSPDRALRTLQQCMDDNKQWMAQFLQSFLTAGSKMFSKPYTVDQLQRIIHCILPAPLPKIDTFPATVFFIPQSIEIYSGKLNLHWELEYEPTMQIDLPDLSTASSTTSSTATSSSTTSSTASSSTPATTATAPPDVLEEIDANEFPLEEDATVESSSWLYDKQRVKEARLKAKLAAYRAEYQMRCYYEKYGNEYFDSDSDLQTTDGEDEYDDEEAYDEEDEEEEEEEEDEIQPASVVASRK